MSEILLQALTTRDIDWLAQIGKHQQVPVGVVLSSLQSGEIYIVLDGKVQLTTQGGQNSILGSAFAALESQPLDMELAELGEGELIGETLLFNHHSPPFKIISLEPVKLLCVSYQLLKQRLEEDWAFAARFYRAIALLLLNRMETLVQKLLLKKRLQIKPLQNVPLLLSQLRDSDVDWLAQQGQVQGFAPGDVLIKAGQRPDSLHILLQGKLGVSVSPERRSLSRAFAALEAKGVEETSLDSEFVRLEPGEMSGEMTIVDDRLATTTTRALEPVLVLTISRQQLLLKLQQDVGFAARFYRVVAMLLSARFQGLVDRLGYGRGNYQVGSSLATEVNYENELDLAELDQLTLGAARFEWMLKRLQLNKKGA
uniref:Cyclic nucleotide-binding protein n=1 Tax=Cyanothece sp. (strain PCC 7425 / ATCC 29141) TaxID=395961 RepID=B8HQH2_CYAP4